MSSGICRRYWRSVAHVAPLIIQLLAMERSMKGVHFAKHCRLVQQHWAMAAML